MGHHEEKNGEPRSKQRQIAVRHIAKRNITRLRWRQWIVQVVSFSSLIASNYYWRDDENSA